MKNRGRPVIKRQRSLIRHTIEDKWSPEKRITTVARTAVLCGVFLPVINFGLPESFCSPHAERMFTQWPRLRLLMRLIRLAGPRRSFWLVHCDVTTPVSHAQLILVSQPKAPPSPQLASCPCFTLDRCQTSLSQLYNS